MTDNSTDGFDWAKDDSVAVQTQPALAVYSNKFGQVVIRREAAWDEEDDVFVHITKQNLLTIIGAMLEAAGMTDVRLYRESGMACHDIDLPTRADRMMAARPDIDWDTANQDFDELQEAEPPKDRTAAERQRRYRANKKLRDIVTKTVTPTVTDRDVADDDGDTSQLRLVG